MTGGGATDHISDDEHLSALGRALEQRESGPDEVVAAAKTSLSWRTIDAELATLTFDSVADDEALAGVRSGGGGGGGGPRALTFEHGDVIVELEVTERGGRRTLIGHVAPAPLDSVEVHQAGQAEPLRQDADPLVRFRVADLAAGPFRLLCRFRPEAGSPVMLTEWVVI